MNQLMASTNEKLKVCCFILEVAAIIFVNASSSVTLQTIENDNLLKLLK